MVKHLPTMRETQAQSLEKEMATHSSALAWKIPWMEEPRRLQSMGSQSQTRLSDFTSLHFMQYCSLQHQTLLLSPVTSAAGYCFCLGSTQLLKRMEHVDSYCLPLCLVRLKEPLFEQHLLGLSLGSPGPPPQEASSHPASSSDLSPPAAALLCAHTLSSGAASSARELTPPITPPSLPLP